MSVNLDTILSRGMYVNGLNRPNTFQYIIDGSHGRNSMNFYKFIKSLTENNYRRANAEDARVEDLVQGSTAVYCGIASTSLAGSDLTVNLTDTNYNNFRNGWVVRDKTGNQGVVVEHGPGYIKLQPGPNVTTWNASTMFLAGQVAYAGENASPSRGSTGTEHLYAVPTRQYNLCQNFRATLPLDRRDLNVNYVTDADGNEFISTYQEDMMMGDFMRGMEIAAIKGIMGKKDVNGKQTPFNGGLDWAISNRNGTVLPLTASPTISDYQYLIEAIRDKANKPGGRLLWMGGTKARSAFFNNPDIRTAIQYSGKDSTFETMRNSGLDITSFQWMGLNMGFMDLPIFNDPNFNPNQSQVTNANIDSSTFYIMAVDQTVDIKGQQLPFAQIIHFDESPEAKYFYVGGTVGTIGAGASAGLSATQFSASGYDGVTAHVQFDGGINISDASGIAKGYMAI